MITLSLCMIVKNEEAILRRCLDSVKDIVDEIIIVDTGSIDKTKEIAKDYTDKIYDFKWVYNFAKARNYSFSKATMDYIMWLDADDVILNEDREKLKILKKILTYDIDIVTLKYNMVLDENSTPILSYIRERIFKRKKNFKWIGEIHEVIQMSGKVLNEDICVTHIKKATSNTKRNLEIFEIMKSKKVPFNARQTFYYARELMYDKQYDKCLKEYEKFLSMKDAWKENKISALIDKSEIYLVKGLEKKALESLFETFTLDIPRSEVCSKIGNIFMMKKDYLIAIYWYNEAINSNYDINSGGFYIKDFHDYIPLLNISVCYYYINNLQMAIEYNEKAGKIKPNGLEYKNNKVFYDNLNNF